MQRIFLPNRISGDARKAAEPEATVTVPYKKMLVLDAPSSHIDNDATPWVSNFIAVDNGIESRPAAKVIGQSSPADVVMGGYLARFSNGSTASIVVTKSKIYRYNISTDTWDEIPSDGSASINGSNLLPVSFSMWSEGDRLCFSQGVDKVLSVDASLDHYHSVSADAYPAYVMETYNRRLNLFKTVEGGTTKPQRHRYCVSGNITDWTGIGSGYRDLSDYDDFVLAAKRLLGALYVYKTDSITRITATGIASTPFQYEQSWSVGRGLLAGRSLAPGGSSHYGLFGDGFFKYNGAQFSPIGNGRVNRYVLDSINPSVTSSLVMVRGHYNSSNSEYTVIYPSASGTFCDRVLVYNERRDLWYYHSFPHELSDLFDHVASVGMTIDGLAGTIGQQSWMYDSGFTRAGYRTVLLAAVDGTASKMTKFDPASFGDYGSTLSIEYQSKDFKIDKPRNMTTMAGLGVAYVDCGLYTITVQTSINGGLSWGDDRTLVLGGLSDGSIRFVWSWFQVTGNQVRFRIVGSSDNRIKIVSFHPIVADGGEII